MRRLLLIAGLVAMAAGPWLAEARAADRLADALAELLDPNVFEPAGTDEAGPLATFRPGEADSRALPDGPTSPFDVPGALVEVVVLPIPPDLARRETTRTGESWPLVVATRRLAWLQSFLF